MSWIRSFPQLIFVLFYWFDLKFNCNYSLGLSFSFLCYPQGIKYMFQKQKIQFFSLELTFNAYRCLNCQSFYICNYISNPTYFLRKYLKHKNLFFSRYHSFQLGGESTKKWTISGILDKVATMFHDQNIC